MAVVNTAPVFECARAAVDNADKACLVERYEGWSSSYLIVAIVVFVLGRLLFSWIAASMDKGDGSADVYTDLWMSNHQAIWDEYVDGAQPVCYNKPYLGTRKMYVPSCMAGRVKSVASLKNPELAAMFDKDGNGKGEY